MATDDLMPDNMATLLGRFAGKPVELSTKCGRPLRGVVGRVNMHIAELAPLEDDDERDAVPLAPDSVPAEPLPSIYVLISDVATVNTITKDGRRWGRPMF